MRYLAKYTPKIRHSIERCNYRCGIECKFVKLTSDIGAKIYDTKRERDYAHKKQQLAYSLKVGPKTGHKFTIKLYGKKRRGYLTQVAKTNIRVINGHVSTKTMAAINSLLDKMRKTKGFKKRIDYHSGNVGKIGKRLVFIDFGPISVK